MTAVLDSGALVAIDKRDRKVGAMLRVLQRDGVPVHTSAGAVTQVWRDGRRQANLARVLPGVDIAALDELAAKRVGELLRASGTSDIVDAHVAQLVQPDGSVLTSDDTDIRALLSDAPGEGGRGPGLTSAARGIPPALRVRVHPRSRS